MKVISTNIGEKKRVRWRFRNVQTGIFKSPSSQILLGAEDVESDCVVDRRYHGGVDKACYLFSADAYDQFKELYPQLIWDWGMFGENVTIDKLPESEIEIGSRFEIGGAEVEVSEPRQPCFKLGIRFGSQKIIKQFVNLERCGLYVRVIKEGIVRPGDEMKLIKSGGGITILDAFRMVYGKEHDQEKVKRALNHQSLAQSTKKDIRKKYQQVF